LRKLLVGIALLAFLGGSLVGCANQSTDVSFTPGSSLTIGQQWLLENANAGVASSLGGSTAASELAILTMPTFYGHAADGTLIANTDFGTVTRKSDTTVTYKLTGKAKWSDGKPVSGSDLNLSVVAATSGFDATTQTGFESRLHSTSLALARVVKVSQTELTLKYPVVPADWQTNLPITAAAHVVAPNGLSTPQSIAEAGKNYTQLTAFALNGVAQAVDLKNFPTAGAYLVTELKADTIFLAHNPEYSWGQAPTVDKLTIKLFNGAGALLKAIKLGSVDLAAPTDTASTSWQQISQLIGSAKGKLVKGIGPDNELVVLNHNAGATFAAATYNGDTAKAALLASGFMHYVPRAGIYSTLLAGSALTKTDSFAFANGTSNYNSSVEQNGTKAYQFQNQELAQEKWQKAGFARKLVVRVLFDSNNPRGQLEYSQLAQWGKVSGFNIQNVSTANVNQALLLGGWDVYIGSFARLDQSPETVAQLSGSLTGLNNGKLSAEIAGLAKITDTTKRAAALSQIERQLIANYAGLPLFELPSMIFTSKKLSKYQANIALQNLTWGYPFWSVSASSK